MPLHRSRGFWPTSLSHAALMLLAVVGGCEQQSTLATPVDPVDPVVESAKQLTADEVVAKYQQEQLAAIADAFAADQRDLAEQLAVLGYTDLNGFSAENISADVLLRHAARRAEASHPGDALRLLAKVAQRIQADSASAASDPVLAPLNAFSREELDRPFAFSTEAVKFEAIRLPVSVEKAVVALSGYGWPHASMAALLLANLHKMGFNSAALDSLAKDAPTLNEYLRRAIAAGTPPPLPAEAVLAIIAEVQAQSAIALVDPVFNALRAELRADLPVHYAAMRDREALTPTARAERAAVRAGAQKEGLLLASFSGFRGIEPPAPSGGVPNPSPDGPGPFTGALGIDGGGRGPGSPHASAARTAYAHWDERIFDPAPPPGSSSAGSGGGGLPRSFRVASRSIRGPGGVSVGAPQKVEIAAIPVSARWLPKPDAPQFGYLLISVRDPSGKVSSALSRLLFAESADAAYRAVFGQAGERSLGYKDGDILPLVSLDGASSEDENNQAVVVNPALAGLKLAWSAVRADFWLRAADGALADARVLQPALDTGAAKTDAAQPKGFTWQIREREHQLRLITIDGLPRVLSCINGAPCTARNYPLGFEIGLFADLPLLQGCAGQTECTPAAILAKVKRMRLPPLDQILAKAPPDRREMLRRIYILQESEIDEQRKELLKVVNRRPGESDAAWTKRLTDPYPLEPATNADARAATRYIGWLSQHHPDFIRLNDFQSGFAVMRWLARGNAKVTPPGALFAPRPYPVPNRIRGGENGTPLQALVAGAQ